MTEKFIALTVDAVIVHKGKILLIRRAGATYHNYWALPGGFVNYGERVEDALIREVKEETGIDVKIDHLLGVYSEPGRDPRGHTVSVVYICSPLADNLQDMKAGDDAAGAGLFAQDGIPDLAFDHNKIVNDAVEWLRQKKSG